MYLWSLSAPPGSLPLVFFPWLLQALPTRVVQCSYTALASLCVVLFLMLTVALSMLNFLIIISLFMLSVSMPLTVIWVGTPFFSLFPNVSILVPPRHLRGPKTAMALPLLPRLRIPLGYSFLSTGLLCGRRFASPPPTLLCFYLA